VELTGQLSNLSALLEKLLSTPLVRTSARAQAPGERRGPVFHQRRYELVRDALLAELAADGGELRLKEILRRVEQRLGEPVEYGPFRDFVNYQPKGAAPLLERLGYGMYRLRPK
jgi:hypothetical protein